MYNLCVLFKYFWPFPKNLLRIRMPILLNQVHNPSAKNITATALTSHIGPLNMSRFNAPNPLR